jgi:pyruvate kinase
MVLYQGVVEEVVPDERVLVSDTFLLFTEVRLADEGFYFCTLTSPLANFTSNKALLNVYSEYLNLCTLTSYDFSH